MGLAVYSLETKPSLRANMRGWSMFILPEERPLGTFRNLTNGAFGKCESCYFQTTASPSEMAHSAPESTRREHLMHTPNELCVTWLPPAALMSLLSPTSLGLAPAWPRFWGLHLQAPIPAL